MKISIRNKNPDINKIMENLQEENKILNEQVAKLKIQLKNNVDSAKAILLEENLKNVEKELTQLKVENNELKNQNENLLEENNNLKHQIIELKAMLEEAAASKE